MKWGENISCLPTAFLAMLEVFWVQLEPDCQHARAWRGSREHPQGLFVVSSQDEFLQQWEMKQIHLVTFEFLSR